MRTHKLDSTPEYMKLAIEHFENVGNSLHILDLPAGSGQLTNRLRQLGHRVTPADICLSGPDYVHADMNETLPFPDNHFDAVVCLEGLEHLLNPYVLIRELIRVTRVGGQVIISTPNIMNMYSRLQFLLTGTFYQFHSSQLEDVKPNELKDRFHISPMSYHRIRYLAEHFGATVEQVYGDKMKRGVLFPVYAVALLAGIPWSRSLFFSKKYIKNKQRNQEIYKQANSWPVRFSRSLIMVLEKSASAEVIYQRRAA